VNPEPKIDPKILKRGEGAEIKHFFDDKSKILKNCPKRGECPPPPPWLSSPDLPLMGHMFPMQSRIIERFLFNTVYLVSFFGGEQGWEKTGFLQSFWPLYYDL